LAKFWPTPVAEALWRRATVLLQVRDVVGMTPSQCAVAAHPADRV